MTDATVIPFTRDRRRKPVNQPQRAATPPVSALGASSDGALFEVPLRAAPAPRTAKPKPASTGKPRRPREPKPAPPPPPRPALRTANSDHELCEGMKRTRRVRVTFEADVYEARFGLGDRLSIVLELPTGERLPITPADIGAHVEVIERGEGVTA